MNARSMIAACVVAAMASAARGDDAAIKYTRDVKTPAATQEELVAVTFDADVYADTLDGFPNLRVQEADGRPVAHVLRKAYSTHAQTVQKTWSRAPTSAKPLESGGLEIVVKLKDDDGRPNGLRIVTGLRDFEQRVQVSTSTDGQQWEPTGEETVIFDHSRYVDVRNLDVAFPETSRRYFKIVIDDVTVEQESELLSLSRKLQGSEEQTRTEKTVVDRRPFRIDSIEFRQDVRIEKLLGEARQDYALGKPQTGEDAQRKQTVIQFAARREPLTSISISTPDRNFSRRAVVEVMRPGGTAWQTLGETTLSRIEFKNVSRRHLFVSFPETRQSQYRLVIDNRDSPPLTVEGVIGKGMVFEAVFLAAPDKKYQFVYGNVEPAKYDTAAIEELLRSGFTPRRGELGEPKSEAAVAAVRTFQWADLLNNGPLLIGVISVLVALLGLGLFRAMKRVDTLPSE